MEEIVVSLYLIVARAELNQMIFTPTGRDIDRMCISLRCICLPILSVLFCWPPLTYRIAGVEIKNKADPVFHKNTIHHGKTGGVYIHEKVSDG